VNYALAHGGKGLIKAATGRKFDVIAAYHIGSGFHNVCFAPGSKAVKYIHGSVATNDALRLDLIRNTDSLARFDKIICVSKNAQTDLLQAFPLKNTCVCYNPLDTDALLKKAEQPSELPNKPYICAVGRLVPIKGFVRLVKCFQKIVQAGHDIVLVIVGDGPDREMINDTIQQMGLQNRVVMIGYSENPYMYMKHSLFTVCSSYSEGMPVVMMESLCLGVPVVSSYKPVEELFMGLPCGITTGIEDEELVNGMLKMLTPKRLMKAKSTANLCSQHIRGKKMVKIVQQVLDDLLFC
jgi:glycosyltransferase involved in cell wall biosynthesis